ncbi:SRPBCC family protein [Luteipulveratus mongoliensis]|uniref:Immediate-early protein 2 n=1 Tax=Luteipulveratus mongoliensis TaxID=571913 RepID=A0A0K1JLQ9_9MICO|nr:SRPBCC family protein [Luteipulveratus mongoliensis]AKU17647.1 hypothetical protein VV02_20365 [Luteipulveratus mongoliensis]
MGVVEIVRETPVPAARLWAVVTDWPRQGEHVPLTRLVVTGGEGVGQVVDAVTGVGRVVIHDPMRVVVWSPPTTTDAGVVRFEKFGRVFGGSAQIEVAPVAGGSRLTWQEEVWPRPERLGRLLAPVTDRAAKLLFGRTVDHLVARAVAGA